jgi:hypothetical protein
MRSVPGPPTNGRPASGAEGTELSGDVDPRSPVNLMTSSPPRRLAPSAALAGLTVTLSLPPEPTKRNPLLVGFWVSNEYDSSSANLNARAWSCVASPWAASTVQ